jgi:serine kinase of HPr protein (carbohydrate metabolism regulator)
MKNTIIHASCVSVNNKAILLLGESGSGKSDLALRLIDGGAQLVADDYTELSLQNNILTAAPPQKLEGLIEARGIGILTLPFIRDVAVKLAVKLVPRADVERLPESHFFDCPTFSNCNLQKIPLLYLSAHDASTPAKIRFFINISG